MRLQTNVNDKHKQRFIRFKKASGSKSDYAATGKLIEMGLDMFERELSPLLHEGESRHRTAAEFMECPDCFPKFEKVMLQKGYVKIQQG